MNAPVAKLRVRVAAGDASGATVRPVAMPAVVRHRAFDAGQTGRRTVSMPRSASDINGLIRSYGATALARSRYLARNNPQTISAKRTFIGALVGKGIRPISQAPDAAFKLALMDAWAEWQQETDADQITNYFGQQVIAAAEMFDAGECFIRMRPRLPEDGLTVPLQLQLLSAEMLPVSDNQDLGNGVKVRCGIVFGPIGNRLAYRFYRERPGSPDFTGAQTEVSADEVLHIYRPLEQGQIRGVPQMLAGVIRAAVMDQYDDAELEAKRVAALFSGFIEQPEPDTAGGPLDEAEDDAADDDVEDGVAFEPGSVVKLAPGEKISFSDPKEVGASYESFQYRMNLAVAQAAGVPYADVTGDLRQVSYGSQRGGMISFRREVEPVQQQAIIPQLCRPVWNAFVDQCVLSEIVPVSREEYYGAERQWRRARHITPRWDWIDPLKDAQAEVILMDNHLKARSTIILERGEDPEEVDAQIAADLARERSLGLPPRKGISAQATGATDAPQNSGNSGQAA